LIERSDLWPDLDRVMTVDTIDESKLHPENKEFYRECLGEAEKLHSEYENRRAELQAFEKVLTKSLCNDVDNFKRRLEIETRRRNVPEAPQLERLLRYEGSLERCIDPTLMQLERHQQMRLGQPVPPPIKVSVSPE
jgi:hypothetical protein